ncbi:MAG: hypothetical protein PHQ03_04095 [Methylococcales bacterium]|nr:hypothetical protein [Methylococcales bacterium]
MASLAGINRLEKEKFECHNCKKEFSDDEIRDTWKCPKCGGYVLIYAEDEETNTKITLIRKVANEVKVGDLVHLPGGLTEESYQVLDIKNYGSKLSIALKNHGVHKVSLNEPINCRVGAW